MVHDSTSQLVEHARASLHPVSGWPCVADAVDVCQTVSAMAELPLAHIVGRGVGLLCVLVYQSRIFPVQVDAGAVSAVDRSAHESEISRAGMPDVCVWCAGGVVSLWEARTRNQARADRRTVSS